MFGNTFRDRNKYYTVVFLTIVTLLLTIVGVSIGANWKYIEKLFEKPAIEITMVEKQFDDLMFKIQKLEELSKQYDEEDYQLRAIIYIRSAAYNDSYWNSVGGQPDANFDKYVEDHQGDYNIKSLKEVSTFVVPSTKDRIDFNHLFATMNTIIKSGSVNSDLADCGGWAGDLCQLIAECDDSGKTGDALRAEVIRLFNSPYSSFNNLDVSADFDAVNIMSNYFNPQFNGSIFLSMRAYYSSLTEGSRIQGFKENVFGNEFKTNSQFENAVYDKMSANIGIVGFASMTGLSQQYGFEFSKNNEVVLMCIKIFAAYIF